MDLTNAFDHPANVLSNYALDAFREGNGQYGGAYATASTRLRAYEVEHGVTFVALDNDALHALTEAWNHDRDNPDSDRAHFVMEALPGLLGLED
jgi:hypothetical protein